MSAQTLLLKKTDADLLNAFNVLTVIVDENDLPLWYNAKFQSLIPDDDHSIDMRIQKALKDSLQNEECHLHVNSVTYYFQPIRSIINLSHKEYTLITLFYISKRKKLEALLREEHEKFKLLSENLPEGIVLEQQNIVYSNPEFERLIEYNGKLLLNKRFVDLIDTPEKSLFEKNIQKLISGHRSTIETTLKLISSQEQKIWVRIKTKRLYLKEAISFLHIITDISYEKEEIDKLYQLAYYDTLTGIYNRRKFNELFKLEQTRFKRFHNHLSALFFDIDHFKNVNDLYGHDIGDLVLKNITRLIGLHIRETDYFARWGGEEFVILLPETSLQEAIELAERIRQDVSAHKFPEVNTVTISIGITTYKGTERGDTFLKRLDNALYQAKKNGRNRCEFL